MIGRFLVFVVAFFRRRLPVANLVAYWRSKTLRVVLLHCAPPPGCVRGQLRTFFCLIKKRACRPRVKVVARGKFAHTGFICDIHFPRFGRVSAFRVLSARNGVLAREIEPSE